jgi:hypothetical protein
VVVDGADACVGPTVVVGALPYGAHHGKREGRICPSAAPQDRP